jgi:hypothetical protein
MAEARGVDLDVIALSPPPAPDALQKTIDSAIIEAGFTRLNGIDEIHLDIMAEWLVPGERCVAVSQPRGAWQLVYDTQFNIAAVADALSRELPGITVVQFNLQERVDLTMRVLKNGSAVYEYSNAPSFFNWGRCVGKSEAPLLARPDAAALATALDILHKASALEPMLAIVKDKKLGERSGAMGAYCGGVMDAVQAIASEAGMPKLYRFFEGWMKSDLDWEEDGVREVRAFRQN